MSKDKSTRYERELIPFYKSTIKKYPILTKEQEIAIAQLKDMGNIEARDTLVLSNIRYVIFQAYKKRQYRYKDSTMIDTDLSLADLVQAGMEGLTKAVNRYNYTRGRLLSYATPWIKGYMNLEIHERGGNPFYISRNEISTIKMIKSTIINFQKENRRSPSIKEISDITGLKESKIEEIIICISNPFYLSDTKSRGYKNTLSFISSQEVKQPDYDISEEDEVRWIREAVKALDEKDRYVIEQHFGINDGTCRTFESLANDPMLYIDDNPITKQAVESRAKRIYKRLKIQSL